LGREDIRRKSVSGIERIKRQGGSARIREKVKTVGVELCPDGVQAIVIPGIRANNLKTPFRKTVQNVDRVLSVAVRTEDYPVGSGVGVLKQVNQDAGSTNKRCH
jgi:hypothetical protein